MTEVDVRRQQGELMSKVNQVIRSFRATQLPSDRVVPQGFLIWRESDMAGSGRPDAHLHQCLPNPSPVRYVRKQRMSEAKKCVHLRNIIKTVAKRADTPGGFTLVLREDGTTALDPGFGEDVSVENRTRIRKILNQVSPSGFSYLHSSSRAESAPTHTPSPSPSPSPSPTPHGLTSMRADRNRLGDERDVRQRRIDQYRHRLRTLPCRSPRCRCTPRRPHGRSQLPTSSSHRQSRSPQPRYSRGRPDPG